MNFLIPLAGLIIGTAVVSFIISAMIRSRALALSAILVIVELGVLLLLYREIAASPNAPEIFGTPPLMAPAAAPVILITAILVVRMVERMRKERRASAG
jgi:hypothetical protein